MVLYHEYLGAARECGIVRKRRNIVASPVDVVRSQTLVYKTIVHPRSARAHELLTTRFTVHVLSTQLSIVFNTVGDFANMLLLYILSQNFILHKLITNNSLSKISNKQHYTSITLYICRIYRLSYQFSIPQIRII